MQYKPKTINPEWLESAAAAARVEPRLIDAVDIADNGDCKLISAVGEIPLGNVGDFDAIAAPVAVKKAA